MAAIGDAAAQELLAAARAAGMSDEEIVAAAGIEIPYLSVISKTRAARMRDAIAARRERTALISEALRLASLGGHDTQRVGQRLATMPTADIRRLVDDTARYLRRKGMDTRTPAEREAAAAAAQARQEAPATERQVQYILDLLRRRRISGEGGGFYSGPTDEAGIRRLTRQQASLYIDSLKGTY